MSRSNNLHERFYRKDDVRIGSERAFGFVFAGIFALIGFWPLLSEGSVRVWALLGAAGFLAASLFAPRLLAPLNRLWFRFGQLLHRIVSPLVMLAIFFFAITPTAFIMRLRGKDLLRLRFDRAAKSYWIERVPPGPAPETMRRQF